MKLQFLNFPFSFFFYLQDSTFAAFISERYVEHRVHREEKSLRHVAMVAKCLDDNKPIKSLHFTDLIQFHLIWQNFLWDRVYRYLSLKQESDNFCVLFAYSIKRAREIRKFAVS